MSALKYSVVASLLLLSACAQPVKQVEQTQTHVAQAETENVDSDVSESVSHHAFASRKSDANLPKIELTGELLYDFLLAEIANQRGHSALAVESSSALAKKTRDPRVAQRAAQLAVEAGEMNKAVEAYRLWQTLEPNAVVANRMLASILLRGGKIEEAEVEFVKALKDNAESISLMFMQVSQMAATHPDKPAALKMMRNLAAPYPHVAEAHWSVAHLAYLAGNNELALEEAKEARRLRPEWSVAVSMEAQVLQKTAPQQALEVMRRYLNKHPKTREIRMQYARALLEHKQYKQAREEFSNLAQDNPNNPDLPFAIAMIALQLNDLVGAEEQLKHSLTKGKKEPEVVHFYLGQVTEMLSREEEALAHYREVKSGEFLVDAQLRSVYLLNKRGKLDEARQQLRMVNAENNQQKVRLILAEAELLREAKQLDNAYVVMQQGLEKLPNHPDLLYETAMLAEKLGKIAVFDELMNKLIKLRPDLPHAYNALGYSLLERKERIQDAVSLIEKAMQIAPDDVAIIDSLGWAYYHVGRMEKSLKLLRKAYASSQDPEIASHLGEVLWVTGEKEEAKKIWQENLKANPGSSYLQKTMKRFIPE